MGVRLPGSRCSTEGLQPWAPTFPLHPHEDTSGTAWFRISQTTHFEHTIQARLTKNAFMSLSIQQMCAFTKCPIGSVYTCGGWHLILQGTHSAGVHSLRNSTQRQHVIVHMHYFSQEPLMKSCAWHGMCVCVWVCGCTYVCALIWFCM